MIGIINLHNFKLTKLIGSTDLLRTDSLHTGAGAGLEEESV